MYHLHAWSLQKLEEGVTSPGSRVRSGCVLPCGFQVGTEPKIAEIKEFSGPCSLRGLRGGAFLPLFSISGFYGHSQSFDSSLRHYVSAFAVPCSSPPVSIFPWYKNNSLED